MELTCNLQAIDSLSRARYDELRTQLGRSVISCSERADGYLVKLDERIISRGQLAEWMSMEQLCCPFLSLGIEPARSGCWN